MSSLLDLFRHRLRGLVSTVLACVLAVPFLLLATPGPSPVSAWEVPPVESPDALHVSADPLPTVQINGVVWDQHIIGDTVYVAGDFTHARPAGSPPGANETPRANMLAYDLTTGDLITSFVADTNAYVRTVTSSPDGSRLYIGGLFTSVNGINRYRIAALDPTTGAVVTSFFATAGYFVYDLVVTDSTVYAGGQFTSAGDSSGLQNRLNLAAFDASTGTLLPWAPSANDAVWTVAISPDESRVFAGGMFSEINGATRVGLAAIDASTGAELTFEPNNHVWAVGPDGAMTDFRVANGALYGSAYTYGRAAGNIEGIFKIDLATDQIVWLDDCHGDTYQHFPVNGYVYKSSHVHYCGNIGGVTQSDSAVTDWGEHGRHAQSYRDEVAGQVLRDPWNYHNLEGYPAPSQTSWAPEWLIGSFTGLGQATWAVEGTSDYVVYGGEFPSINGVAQQGLVRFAVRAIAPNDDGPVVIPDDFKLTSPASGEVRVSLPANIDRDDHVLTYELLRGSTVVDSQVVASTFWDRPAVSFQRTGLTPGETHNYWVRVSDPWGNATWTPIKPVTISGGASESPYVDQVIADGARIYWRLGESPGSGSANDLVGFNDGTVTSMDFGQPGVLIGDPDTAVSPTSDDSRVVQPGYQTRVSGGHIERHPVEHELSVEIWFKTTSNDGGRLIGFGDRDDADSRSTRRDRHLYLTDDGTVVFGVRTSPGGTGVVSSRVNRVAESAPGFNDGEWHHAVGTLSPDGMRLYVDGAQVDSLPDSDVNTGTGYYGYWRVGADDLDDTNSNRNWPNAPSSKWLDGDLDEAAVYYDALTPQQVQNHWVLSGHAGNIPPSAVFVATPALLDVAFDGSGSDDPDGSIVSWDWDFGDGGSGAGEFTSHTYAAAGTYTVELAVVDDDGASDVFSDDITVEAPNQPPVAVFVATPALLDVAFDGSGSGDPDGSIVSWDWDFGDGGSGAGEFTSHTYAAAGTYTVELAVVDDDGASDVFSDDITVEAPNQPPVAVFVATPALLDVAFDGSGSGDPDGSIVSWDWDFGDGGSGAGEFTSHTYAAAGTYTVELTVVDDDGLTDQVSHDVTVDDSVPVVFAQDAFGRVLTGTWGSADVGGAWSLTNGAVPWAVDGDRGTVATDPGTARRALLEVSGSEVSGVVDLSWDQAPSGGGMYTHLRLREQGSTTYYTARVRTTPTATYLTLERSVDGVWARMATVGFAGLVYSPGEVWRLAFELEGTSPTELRAKVWNVAGSEPGWQATATDSTAGLQQAGGLGLQVYESASAAGPVVTSFDNLNLGSIGAAANLPPVAVFVATPALLDVAFDGSGSGDPDGSIVSWDWDFGDGGSGAGEFTSHTYAAAGTYTVELTVVDDDGLTDQVSHDVTVDTANLPPVAVFVATPALLDVAFDGSGSGDPDGSIVSWDWDFGDGGSGAGEFTSHTYAAAGTYTVELTVVDDDGLTDQVSHDVTVDDSVPVVFAQDAFGRVLTGTWGSADVGGAWSLTNGAVPWAVDGDRGTVATDPGTARRALLEVSGSEVSGVVDLSWDQAPSGGGMYTHLRLREQGSTTYYTARVRTTPTATYLTLERSVDGVWARMATVGFAGLVYSPGEVWRLAFELEGTSPTELRAKVWNVAGSEPGWQATATDSTAGLQQAGGLGLQVYESASAAGPVVTSFDNLNLGSIGAAANLPPVAVFVATPALLDVAFDGSGSGDPDGSIVSWDWDFGDGGSGAGEFTSHTYAAAGTYTVELTVVDDDGLTDQVSHDVTVDDSVPVVFAQDAFGRVLTGTWGSADVGGAWSLTNGAVPWAVDGDRGTVATDPGTARRALLEVSGSEVSGVVDLSWDQAPSGGGMYTHLRLREQGSTTYYTARVRTTPTATYLTLERSVDGVWARMATVGFAGLVYSPGEVWRLAFELEGTSPTELRAKVWNVAGSEPGWQATATDSTAGLQQAGGLGLQVYESASAAGPVVTSFDNLNLSPLPAL